MSLVGQPSSAFSVDLGRRSVSLPAELGEVYKIGWRLTSCARKDTAFHLIECLSMDLLSLAPAAYVGVAVRKLNIMDLVPSQVRQVVQWNEEAVRTVFSVGNQLMQCPNRGHEHDLIKCLGDWIMQFKPPMNYMPDPVKKLANGRIMDLVPSQVRQVVQWNEEAVRTVFSVGYELMHCPNRGHHHDLIKCLGDWIMNFKPPMNYMPDPVKKLADGRIMDLVPSQVRQVASWNEEAVRTVFSVGFELMHCPNRGHHHDLIKCLGGWIMHLNPPVDYMPDPVKKLADGRMMDLMPQHMGLLANGDPNSIQNMLTLGQELVKCADASTTSPATAQRDIVQCLGFQIVSRVAPLNFLNKLGDIFAEFIETFSKVAAAVIPQAMKGGQSLLQIAATTDFPSISAGPVVHHRGLPFSVGCC